MTTNRSSWQVISLECWVFQSRRRKERRKQCHDFTTRPIIFLLFSNPEALVFACCVSASDSNRGFNSCESRKTLSLLLGVLYFLIYSTSQPCFSSWLISIWFPPQLWKTGLIFFILGIKALEVAAKVRALRLQAPLKSSWFLATLNQHPQASSVTRIWWLSPHPEHMFPSVPRNTISLWSTHILFPMLANLSRDFELKEKWACTDRFGVMVPY